MKLLLTLVFLINHASVNIIIVQESRHYSSFVSIIDFLILEINLKFYIRSFIWRSVTFTPLKI